MAYHSITADQFWAKAIRQDDGCWIWQGACTTSGYGCQSIKGRQIAAHRYAWELTHGAIPPGLHALHKCDIKRCINPDHLFLGTHAENMADKAAKGKAPGVRADSNRNAKLNWDAVHLIRRSPLSTYALAEQLGVSHTTIHLVRTGKAWIEPL